MGQTTRAGRIHRGPIATAPGAGDTPEVAVVGAWAAEVDSYVVGMAVGLLVGQRRCSPHRGFSLLTDLATRTGRSVTDEAHRLVVGRTSTRAVASPGDDPRNGGSGS